MDGAAAPAAPVDPAAPAVGGQHRRKGPGAAGAARLDNQVAQVGREAVLARVVFARVKGYPHWPVSLLRARARTLVRVVRGYDPAASPGTGSGPARRGGRVHQDEFFRSSLPPSSSLAPNNLPALERARRRLLGSS
jgi:hypothetical protein